MKTKLAVVVLSLMLGQTANAEDRFQDIRKVWPTCAGCHGAQGQGIGSFPALAGQDADSIIESLLAYKNKELRGPMSSLMWQQASMLTDGQIGTIGVFVSEDFPES
jgi:cytochrome c553